MAANNFDNQGPAFIVHTVHGNVQTTTNIGMQIKENPIYFGLNEPDPKFTGRKNELSLLENTIKNSLIADQGAVAVVICGLGGIGKTQLLRKFIAQTQLPPTPAYCNVIWINSESISLMLKAFIELADHLSITVRREDEIPDKVFKYLIPNLLNKLSSSSTVIVFDNVDEEDNKKIIKIVLTTGVSGTRPHVIITSRIQNWSDSIHAIKLEVFNDDDALEYVSSKLWNPDNIYNDSIETLALVYLVQNYPLALSQAVAHINYHRKFNRKGVKGVRKYTISDYVCDYNEYQKETLNSNFFQKDEFNLYDRTVLTTWNITIEAITKYEAAGGLALKILRIIAYFNPDHILVDILFHLADIEDVMVAVNLLLNHSMLNSHNHQSVLSIHRLVQQVTKIELEGNPESNKAILQTGLEIILKMSENCEFEQCLEHGISVFLAASHIVELVHQYKTFPGVILYHLNQYRKFFRAINFGEEIVERLTHVLGENDTEILACKFWLALSHRSVHNLFESLRIDSEVFEKRKEILGENHRDTLTSKTSVAIGHAYMGRDDEALKMHEEILEQQLIILENFENQRDLQLDILVSKFRIALLHNKLGHTSESLSMHQQVYEQRKQILGDDHTDTLESMTNIGLAYNHIGRGSDALRMHQMVYDKRKAIGFRDDDPQVILSKTQIALSYCGLRKSVEAAEIYEQLHEQSKKIFGEHHPRTLDLKYDIGGMYNVLGRHDEALRIHEEVLEKRRTIFEENSTRVLQCKSMIAKTYMLSGKYTKALQMFEDGYEIAKDALGEDVILTLRFKLFVAHCYRYLGEYNKALRLYEEIFDRHKEIWGADDTKTLDTQFEIANAYNDLGKFNEALQIHKDVFEKRKVTLGGDHKLPRILASKSKIADTYNRLGKHTEALQLHQEVFETQKTFSKDNHPTSLQYKSNVADAYNHLGEHSTAYQMHREVYGQRSILLGDNHPRTLDSKFRIAICHNKLGEHSLASRTHQEVYDQRRNILGKNHPHTLDSKLHISISINNLSKYSKARRMPGKVLEPNTNTNLRRSLRITNKQVNTAADRKRQVNTRKP